MKRVTVKDIANTLNIAQGTVSKALSGRPGVSEDMKRRVLDAAHALGYKVNPLAKGLSQSPIDIGIVIPGVWPAYFSLSRQVLRPSSSATATIGLTRSTGT